MQIGNQTCQDAFQQNGESFLIQEEAQSLRDYNIYMVHHNGTLKNVPILIIPNA